MLKKGVTIMTRYRLRANKTSMVNLLQANGYNPTVRTAHFNKGPGRHRAFWLRWVQDKVLHEALLSSAGGAAFVRVTHGGSTAFIQLSFAELDKFNLKEAAA